MEDADWKSRLREEAERIRLGKRLGKSAQINRLFDYLVERSLMGTATKEIEVAREVFGWSADSNAGLDATVRTHVHRLRKKLDELAAESDGDHLALPRGEYRLVLVPQEHDGGRGILFDRPGRSAASISIRGRHLFWIAAGLFGLAPAGWLGWIAHAGYHPADRRAASAFWKPLTTSRFPTLMVMGDDYTFGEFNDHGAVARLIRDPAINTRQDLDREKLLVGGASKGFVDLDYHTLPEAMGPALTMVAPIVHAATGDPERPAVVGISRFPTEMLGRNNIVYVGLLGGLRLLAAPLFEGSRFSVSDDGDSILDRETKRRFESDWADPAEDRLLRHDYAYISSRPGPIGNWILVISGTRDPALKEAAQIVSSRAKLDQLARIAGNGPFEAVYEVRTYGPSNYTSRPIIVRPIPAGARVPGADPAKAQSRRQPSP